MVPRIPTLTPAEAFCLGAMERHGPQTAHSLTYGAVAHGVIDRPDRGIWGRIQLRRLNKSGLVHSASPTSYVLTGLGRAALGAYRAQGRGRKTA